jgi:outer membrane protein OmpA-like peptidoglycan-associated protein
MFLYFPLVVPAQNLLMNGGFEEENICTEYEKNCAPEGWISTSLFADYYFEDAVNAFEGAHFVGLPVADGNRQQGRNFLRSRLLCGLRKGAQYRVEFYVRSRHAVFDSVGVYFSGHDFLYQKEKLRNTSPQILLQEADSLAPSKTWQKVSLTYTATGEENFISIGDFKRGAHSIAGTPDLGRDYYFFIDDVSLKPLNPSEKLCPGWTRLKEDEYDFNVRHSQLDKLIYVYTRRPPLVEAAPKTVVHRIDTLVIPDVLFATNSYTLEAGAKDVLDEFVGKVKSVQVDSVVVEGHTDSHGSMALNQQLSQNRAASVASYIQPHFQTATLTKAFASQKPVADNRTSAGRQKNRRVEIYIYVRE